MSSGTPAAGVDPRRRWIRNTWWAGLLLAAVWLFYVQSTRVHVIPAGEATPADPLFVLGVDGRMIDLADHRGKVVVVNLWASWCAPCRSEIPAFSRTQAALRDRGLWVLGINVEDLPIEQVAELQRELGMTFSGAVPHRPLGGTFVPAGKIPQTWLIDRQGRVRANHVGMITESALRKACLRLLDE